MNHKPVCLIGGGGFIGSRFRAVLAERQAVVAVVGRSPPDSAFDNEIHLDTSRMDWDSIRQALSRFQFGAIVDLAYASVPNSSFADPARDVSENLGGVLRHLELCAQLKTERFVYISSGGTIYGEGRGTPLKEDDPVFPLSPYGITKLACERYVYLYHRIHALPAIIVRPANIYGQGQRPFRGQGLVSTAFGAAYQGRPLPVFGDGSNVRDYLHVDDMCSALDAVLDHAEPGEILNLGSGEGVRAIDLLRMIGDLAAERGHELRLDFQPARPFDVRYNVLDIARLRERTGWRPAVTLADGLRQSRDWVEQALDRA